MREELISFDTAKLAKNKGFDWLVKWACKEWEYQGEKNVVDIPKSMIDYHMTFFREDEEVINYGQNFNKLNGNCFNISVPTQSLLQRWLREVHKIHIQIYLEDSPRNFYWESYLILYGLKDRNYIDELFWDEPTEKELGNKSKTYEEALEFALQEALKLI